MWEPVELSLLRRGAMHAGREADSRCFGVAMHPIVREPDYSTCFGGAMHAGREGGLLVLFPGGAMHPLRRR